MLDYKFKRFIFNKTQASPARDRITIAGLAYHWTFGERRASRCGNNGSIPRLAFSRPLVRRP